MRTLQFFALVFTATSVLGCRDNGWSLGRKPVDAPLAAGRFVLLSAPPTTLRMDTATGETWTLTDGRWTSVEDNLIVSGKYNPATKKVEWGTKAPDGRDLQQLSKEELIRIIEAMVKRQPMVDPKDPIGIR